MITQVNVVGIDIVLLVIFEVQIQFGIYKFFSFLIL